MSARDALATAVAELKEARSFILDDRRRVAGLERLGRVIDNLGAALATPVAQASSEVIPAVLGWSNPTTAGGASVRLYALDVDPSPRWARDGGRTIERALVERDGGNFEGDRYLVVRLGDRFVKDEAAERVTAAILAALEES